MSGGPDSIRRSAPIPIPGAPQPKPAEKKGVLGESRKVSANGNGPGAAARVAEAGKRAIAPGPGPAAGRAPAPGPAAGKSAQQQGIEALQDQILQLQHALDFNDPNRAAIEENLPRLTEQYVRDAGARCYDLMQKAENIENHYAEVLREVPLLRKSLKKTANAIVEQFAKFSADLLVVNSRLEARQKEFDKLGQPPADLNAAIALTDKIEELKAEGSTLRKGKDFYERQVAVNLPSMREMIAVLEDLGHRFKKAA